MMGEKVFRDFRSLYLIDKKVITNYDGKDSLARKNDIVSIELRRLKRMEL